MIRILHLCFADQPDDAGLRGNASLTPLPMSGDRVLLPLVSLTTYNGEPYTQPDTVNICSRTSQVQTAILAATPTDSDPCSTVLTSELAEITSLALPSQSISVLASGDFAGLTGLTALTALTLIGNTLTTPDDVFDPLSSLIVVNLQSNQLTALPADVFDGLTSLTHLRLGANDLTAPPAEVFADLTSLTNLELQNNQLAALPAEVFADLTSLTNLELQNNQLAALPEGVFDSLTRLTELDLRRNSGLTLPVSGDRVLLPLAALTTYNGAAYAQPLRTDICDPRLRWRRPYWPRCPSPSPAARCPRRSWRASRPWTCRARASPPCGRATSPGLRAWRPWASP